tara:strand:- start:375 stop:2402 length:2028 start_codon:yes stop_codon:yes gene_type:complete
MLSQKLTLAAAGNAADPTYVDEVFSTFLYDGTSSAQTITNGIDLSGEGGMVWIKGRSNSVSSMIWDTERGARKYLITSNTNAESTSGSNAGLTQFNSDGFGLGTNWNTENFSSYTYCSWSFRKCPGFFDVVSYTGNGTAGRTIAHSLGSTPGMVVVKNSGTATTKWAVWHTSYGDNNRLYFNENTAGAANQTNHVRTASSTTFTVGSDYDVNANGQSYVAYVFANNDQSFGENGDEAIIKCGSYTGNGGTQSINVGFEPQFLITKRTDGTGNWFIHDITRKFSATGTDEAATLRVNSDVAEAANTARIHVNSTGFDFDNEASGDVNSSSSNYVYVAIRRPHKPAENSTDVLDIVQHSGNSTARHIAGTSGSKPADMHIIRRVNTSGEPSFIGARILNSYSFPTDDDSKEAATNNKYGGSSALPWDVMTGINLDTDAAMNTSGNTYINYFLTRHPGVFEAVTYEGNGANRTISHNLGVAPDLMIFRNLDRSSGQKTPVYVSGITHLSVFGSDPDSYGSNPGIFLLNAGDKATFSSSGYLNHTHPTSSVFSLGDTFHINENAKTHIAFLFANLAGICKIGTYTGVGGSTDVDVDCGFTSGARLVIIKKATNISAWRVFDTTRGINSGTETYWFFNNTFTATFDVIDPINSGFRVVNETAAAQGLNVSGHVYIFMAFS